MTLVDKGKGNAALNWMECGMDRSQTVLEAQTRETVELISTLTL